MSEVEVAERINAGLIPKASRALDRIAAVDGLSRTDALNRALQVYAFVLDEVVRRGGQLAVEWPDGSTQTIEMTPGGEAQIP